MDHKDLVEKLAKSVVGNHLDATVWFYHAQPSGRFTMTVSFSKPVGEIGLEKLRDAILDFQREVYGVYRDLGKFFEGVVDDRSASYEIRDWIASESKVIGFRCRVSYTGKASEDLSGTYPDLFSRLVQQVGGKVNLVLHTL